MIIGAVTNYLFKFSYAFGQDSSKSNALLCSSNAHKGLEIFEKSFMNLLVTTRIQKYREHWCRDLNSGILVSELLVNRVKLNV